MGRGGEGPVPRGEVNGGLKVRYCLSKEEERGTVFWLQIHYMWSINHGSVLAPLGTIHVVCFKLS